MNDENTFRLVVLTWVAVALPIGLFFRIRTMAGGEKLDRWQEGVWILFPLRLLGLTFWISILLYLINPTWMAWGSVALPGGLRWAGVVLGSLAIPLITWVFYTLGRNLTDTVVTRAEHTLVTAGPYRWVRHPFYVTGFLMFVGMSLVMASWFVALVGVTALSLLALRTPIEERKLLERFGDDYRRYMAATGRFWPRLFAIDMRGPV